MVGHGGSNASSYLADPTSPIPSYCASIVVTSTVRVKGLMSDLVNCCTGVDMSIATLKVLTLTRHCETFTQPHAMHTSVMHTSFTVSSLCT